jgi:hypothetical protein
MQQSLDDHGGDYHLALVRLADDVLLPNQHDDVSPTDHDRVVCHHISEICRCFGGTVYTDSGEVFVTGPSEEYTSLETDGFVELQP